MRIVLIERFAAAAALVAVVVAQPVPLPNTYDGFAIGDVAAPVMLEGFLDLLCPDCAQAWPTLKQVASHYGPSKLRFLMHVFPLPYHTCVQATPLFTGKTRGF